MAETVSGGLRISYEDVGSGEPALLLMPGWCGSRKILEPLAHRCAQRRRVLALDWRGHGQSEKPSEDFGSAELFEDALSVIGTSGASAVVPVALSHAGWVAIELRRRLGRRVPKLVLLDWIVLEAPPPFLAALEGLQSPAAWQQTREQLFSLWLHGLELPALESYVRNDMGSYGFDMWARAGREISAAYAQAGSPLRALAALAPPVPVLHLYSQPDDPAWLAAQQSFAADHPWFHVRKLDARSHFPMAEQPARMAEAIEQFVA